MCVDLDMKTGGWIDHRKTVCPKHLIIIKH